LALLSNGSVIGWGNPDDGKINPVMATYSDVALITAGHNNTALFRTTSNSIWYFGARLDDLPVASAELLARSGLSVPEEARVVALDVSRWFVTALVYTTLPMAAPGPLPGHAGELA
jgi:hypothetical protein